MSTIKPVVGAGGGSGGGGVPSDGSVTNVKVSASAAISADKLVDGSANKLMSAAERTKLTALPTSSYSAVQDEGSALTGRPTLNFVGGGVTTTDDTGNARTVVTIPGGSGGGGTGDLANVKDFGAVGNGSTDDTTAIAAAFAAGRGVYFPKGNYVYTGAGITATNIYIRGVGDNQSQILLPAGGSFITTTGVMSDLRMYGMDFKNGFGAIRLGNTGSNVTGHFTVEDCWFENYTGCAISNVSTDMPYWKINRCGFSSANYNTTIGIALSGLTDQSSIMNCSFLKNRVHVKLAQGGNNAHVIGCDMLRFQGGTGFPRIDVWLVPRDDVVNDGNGMTIRDCKFGNENLEAGDLGICYADEDAVGATIADKFPVLNVESTGWIQGHSVSDCLVNGTTGANRPIVFTTTKNIRDSRYGPIFIAGSLPPYVIQYLVAPTADRLNMGNVFGPILGQVATETAPMFPLSNAAQPGTVIDPTGSFSTRTDTENIVGALDPSGYVNMLTTAVTAFTTSGNTYAGATDALGGTEAIQITTTTTGITYSGLSNVTVGRPAWVEFDVAAPTSGTPLTVLQMHLQYTSNGQVHYRRAVQVPTSGAVRYRFRWVPREATTTINIVFIGDGDVGTVRVGRVRVYHAREPQPAILSVPYSTGLTTTTAPSAGGAGALPATPLGYLTVNVGGTLRKIAYY